MKDSCVLADRFQSISLKALGTHKTGIFNEGASEIVAHDPATQRVFVINADAAVVDVLDISDPANPTLTSSIDVSSDIGANGGINSVDVKNGIVAVAVENHDPTLNGFVVFYDTDGTFITSKSVGNLPDALKFSADGKIIVVANEGEPVGDGGDPEALLADPKGSISIIDISGGVIPATVTTLNFSSFDGREAEFAAKGVKIQPGKSLSIDLEPEFPAISEDGTQAVVTLQEANAFAIVDLTVPEIVDIVPLGFKDHSKGQPRLELFPFNKLPKLGTDATGLDIILGGFSGLAFEMKNKDKLSFMTVPDLGPNGADVVAGKRTFNLPDYQGRIVFFDVHLQSKNAIIKNGKTILLTRDDGFGKKIPITGLPNVPGFDEEPVDAAGNPVPYDPFGADLEGIVRDPVDNTFWMVDEYRPAIYHFDTKGKLITRLVPKGTSALSPVEVQAAGHGVDQSKIVPGFYGDEELPAVYNKHRLNRGFEAVAMDYENRILYAFIQSPLDNPDKDQRTSSILRILGVDVNSGSATYLMPVSEYVYLLEKPSHALDTSVDKIGDAIFIGKGKFITIERDSTIDPKGKKYIFEIDIHGATNIRGMPIANEVDPNDDPLVNTLEELSPDKLAEAGITPVNKMKLINLPSIGYLPSDKPEGIALLPDGRIAVLNDNDFGIDTSTGLIPVLGLISFDKGNAFDPSDKDAKITIKNWPTFGMYQPDSIDAYEANGTTFYITANEGDSRDFDFFSEEKRVEDLILDPTAFPGADDLQKDETLGRLKTTTLLGDTDADSDFDKIFSYGARSFSIWDCFGNLVFDSGDDFEKKTAKKLPASFNSDNEKNDSFDARSDDKGPEPEGIEIGRVGSKILAFIGLERVGGIMVYDVTNPWKVKFLDYVNTRNFRVPVQNDDGTTNPAAGDLGPEGLHFISEEDSPIGSALLVAGNEVSGSTTIYKIYSNDDDNGHKDHDNGD